MRRFRVRNWEKFQHYKDRNPPWIKLHVEILSSEDWVTLDDASKLLAVVCMVIAAKHDGCVPDNPGYIRRVAYLKTRPNLEPLIACGFLMETPAVDSDSKHTQAEFRPETETETETEKKDLPAGAGESKPKRYPEDFEAFWKAYPTDSNMAKKPAFRIWRHLSPEQRQAAIAAIPGFKRYCEQNKSWYRPIYAERFLSQEKFEGYAAEPEITQTQIEANKDRADRLMRRGKYAVNYQ